MNGENAFGWLKVIAVLLAVIVVGVILWKGWGIIKDIGKKISDFVSFGGGFKTANPISKAVDAPISWLSGGDSLGTLLASWFSPAAKAADKAIANAPVYANTDHSGFYLYGDDNPPTIPDNAPAPKNPNIFYKIFGGGFSDGAN